MPEYPIPPWLQAADPTKYQTEGMRLGMEAAQATISAQQKNAQLQMEQQRMQNEQEQTALSFALKQQQAQRENDLQQQRIAVDAAYKQQIGALRMQQLQTAQEKLTMQAQQQAQRALSYQGYMKDFEDAGDDPQKQAAAAMKWGPLLSASGAMPSGGIQALSRGAITAPESIKSIPVEGQPGVFGYQDPTTGRVGLHNVPGADVPGYVSPRERLKAQQQRQAQSALEKFESNPQFALYRDYLTGAKDPKELGPARAKEFPAIRDTWERLKKAAKGEGESAGTTERPTAQFRYDPTSGTLSPVKTEARSEAPPDEEDQELR